VIPKEKNKPVVLITGASSGIGKSMCENFFEAGYHVIGVDRQAEEGLPYNIFGFDISRLGRSDKECENFFRCIEEYSNGCLNVLVNNTAVQIIKPIDAITAKDWAVTLDTNLLASIQASNHLISSGLASLKDPKPKVCFFN
jgi:NAD(P)-dependent dehydrogenase (short-subunit alcohol dehydrogenase family)